MNKQKVPQLRFPGFDGEWKEKKMGNITEKVNSGKTPLGGESVYVDEGILFIRSQNVLDSKLSFENSTFIPEVINNTMKNSVVIANDILLNITGASLGRSCVVPNDFTTGNVNQHVCIIRLDKENSPYFVQPIFSSVKGQNIFSSLQTGSGREGLNFQSIKGITLSIPTLPEQQKIASFLSAVDEKIQQLSRKKELLEQYKKGVMQQLFSGKLRFKDENGNDYIFWEEKKFGEVFKSISTKKYQIKSTAFNLEGKFKVIDQGQKTIAGYSDNEENVFKNTPIIVFGDHTTILKYIDFDFIVGGDGTKLLKNINSDNLKYLFYNLLYNNVNQEGYKRHFTMLSELKLQIPSIQEQQKIANFLSSIDAKIENTKDELEKIQLFKKGLLQQLFV